MKLFAVTKIFSLFDTRSKVMALLLVFMILIGVVLEMLGIGAVIPLVALFASPNPLETSKALKRAHDWLGPESEVQFVTWILIGAILLYIIKNIYLFALAYLQNRFILNKQYQLGSRLFRGYLHSPYEFHLKHNSSELLRNIKLVGEMMNLVFTPMIICFTEFMVVTGVVFLLVWVDPISAFSITLSAGIFLGVYYWFSRKIVRKLGKDSKYHEGKTYQQIYQSLNAIKELKVSGKEGFFSEVFSRHLWGFTYANCTSTLIGSWGRYLVEGMTVSSILGVMVFFLNSAKSLSAMLVTFSLFMVAAMRIIPSVNRLNWAFTTMGYATPIVGEAFSHLKKSEKLVAEVLNGRTAESILYDGQIEFRNVSHKYENSDNLSLDSFSLKIPKKSIVALVGASGAGKSTALSLIAGLLKPTSGDVLVDGKDIHRALFSWQQQIGYVPQSIYLLDDTVRNNVAFGVQEDNVSEDKVWEVLRLAQLDSFVKELPNGLDAIIGENGVRFSGGQRQRIGIARALYGEPKVLIMDEATAALDNETERSFMADVESFRGERTIIWTAHRITSIKNCDIIFFLKHGRMIASGTYDSLLSESVEFRQMVQG
jgi:ATP-binding cassette, subfamily B, bacterial PglK